MRRTTSLALVAACVAALGSAALPAAAAPHHATGKDLASAPLAHSVFPGLANAHRTGALPAGKQIAVGLSLTQNTAEIDAYNAHVYTPGDPLFHHFLTPAEVATRFALPADTVAAAKAWATRDGLTVQNTTLTGSTIFLTGTAAQAEQTFGTTLGTYTYGTESFYANDTELTVPTGLGVTGVLGMNDLQRSHTFAKAQSDCTATCMGLTTPQDMWSAYDAPAGNKGEGQTMAIFGEGETDSVIADLRTFEGLNGLRRIPINVVHADGANADYSDAAGAVEWNLDTQSSTGMSPNALSETLYFGKDLTDDSVLNVLTTWNKDANGPLQASASYGECEVNPDSAAGAPGTSVAGAAGSSGAAYTVSYENQLAVANSMGRSLFASTGDTGGSCPLVAAAVIGAGNGVANQGYPVVNYPASSPHVTAVGGTVLYTDSDTAAGDPSTAKRVLEYSWTFTGGGQSQAFPKPAYQNGINVIQAPCVTDASTFPAPRTTPVACRGIPDVAALSGDVSGNGYAIVAGGETAYPGGGTSLSSPMTMGLWTRIQAAHKTAGGNGFANTALYGLGLDTTKDAKDFFDIGGTTNSQPGNSQPTGNGQYSPLPRSAADPSGWDYTSGLGVMDVAKVMDDLDGTEAPLNPALGAEAPLPGAGAGGTVDPACIPAFTDAKGDDALPEDLTGGSNPQLDIVQGDLHYVKVNGVDSIQTILTIANLTTDMASPAGAANEYYFLFTYGGTQYFTSADVDSVTGAITYGYGSVSGNQYNNGSNGGTTGSFTPGANGTVVVTTPLANVGVTAPKSTTALLAPAGQTKVLVGASAVGGSLQGADSASDGSQTFTLGEVCSATGKPGTSGGSGAAATLPESPVAVGLPVLGLVLAGGAAYAVRRRRQAA